MLFASSAFVVLHEVLNYLAMMSAADEAVIDNTCGGIVFEASEEKLKKGGYLR